MGLHYPNTINFTIWGTKTIVTLDDKVTPDTAARTSVALTAAYQSESGFTKPTQAFETSGYSKLNLNILYTMGSGESTNSIEIKIECSSDGVNYYRIPNEAVSTSTSTLTAREFTFVGENAAATTISIGLDIFYKYIKVSVKETGKDTNFGTTYAEVTLLGK